MKPEEIKRVRKNLGMTQTQFADAIGVSFATMNRWERGHCEPLPDRETRIRELFNRMRERESRDWVVYLLKCGDGTLYCGITNDIKKRLWAHRQGQGAKYTRGRTPIVLHAYRGGLTKRQALKLEARVKKTPKARKKAVLLTWTCCPHCGKEIQ